MDEWYGIVCCPATHPVLERAANANDIDHCSNEDGQRLPAISRVNSARRRLRADSFSASDANGSQMRGPFIAEGEQPPPSSHRGLQALAPDSLGPQMCAAAALGERATCIVVGLQLPSNGLSGSLALPPAGRVGGDGGLCELAHMQVLDLSGNGLSGGLPNADGACWSHLRELDVSSNALVGDVPPWVLKSAALQRVDLEGNLLVVLPQV